MSSPCASSVKVEPVSDPSELHTLASIFDIAITASGDKFNEVLMRYVEDPYKETMKQLEAALSAKVDEHSSEQHFLFKAIMTVPKHSARECKGLGLGNAGGLLSETPTEEKIVGMAHWTVGYINLPKVDPFEQQTVASLAPATIDEPSTEATPLEEPIATGTETVADSKPESDTQPFDFYAVCRKPVRNTYISQIRGKKHVLASLSPILYPPRRYTFVLSHSTDLRRIAVHPNYQRRGVAGQLLQWGLDRADSEKLVSYLNGRPQARQLYENSGFRAVNIIPMPVPGLEVADMIAMVRQPQVAPTSVVTCRRTSTAAICDIAVFQYPLQHFSNLEYSI